MSNTEKVLPLRFDNFTSLTRTPWAGHKIIRDVKKHLLGDTRLERVGESWEFSLDPDFPSKLKSSGAFVGQWIQANEEYFYGKGEKKCEILVKLLNASQPLSLQVHPKDGDENLVQGECGKPESWYVLDAEPGSGLYLGFSQSLEKSELRAKIDAGEDLQELLQFVPVSKGDYFEIEPGVPHAIGPGVLLLEPQRVVSGMHGKTYRIWDWNRKYDKDGNLSPDGEKRQCHVEEALRLIDPMKQVGKEFLDSIQKSPLGESDSCTSYPKNANYQLHILKAQAGRLEVDLRGSFAVIYTICGEWRCDNETVTSGASAVIPAGAFPLDLHCSGDCEIALLHPPHGELQTSAT